MFKDSLPSYQLPQPNDLSVPPKYSKTIVSFIDNHIADFPHYYNQNKDFNKDYSSKIVILATWMIIPFSTLIVSKIN